jgi:hypothetical protein
MHFTTEHRFPGAPEQVVALMVDPAFEGAVDLPDLSTPEVLEHAAPSPASPAWSLRLRYEYIGELDGLARRITAGRKLTLVQWVGFDTAAGPGRYSLEAEADPGRVHGAATITLTRDGAECVRRFDGDFVVKVPLMGGTIEKRLLPGILSRFDVEAEALADRLRAGGTGDAPARNRT